MRTLSDTLTAEQKKASRTPYVRLYLSAASSSPASPASYHICSVPNSYSAWPGSRCIARKSDGTLCAVWTSKPGDYSRVFVIYSADDGLTWSGAETISPEENYHHKYPVIAVDSNDYIHVVWSGGSPPQILYRKKTASWQDIEVAYEEAGANHYQPTMAIDSNDYVHVAWRKVVYLNHRIYYRCRTDSWGSAVQVSDDDDNCAFPTIAIDYSDNIHLVWIRNASGGDPSDMSIRYREYTDSSWQSEETIYTAASDDIAYFVYIAVDEANNPYVCWHTNNSGTLYSKKVSVWLTEETIDTPGVGMAGIDLDVALDSYSNVHTFFIPALESGSYILSTRKRTSYTWLDKQTIPEVGSSGYNHRPKLLWAAWPQIAGKRTNRPKTGYAGAYLHVDGDTVYLTYVVSPDLTWE